MECTTEGLRKEQENNYIKDSITEEPNEKVCSITKEKMKMKSESDKSIGGLNSSNNVVKEELLPQKEVSKAGNLENMLRKK